MSDGNDQDGNKGRLSLRPAGRLELGRTEAAGSVRQSFSHGRSKVVQVEVRKTRPPVGRGPSAAAGAPPPPPAGGIPAPRPPVQPAKPAPGQHRALTATEQAARQRALEALAKENARREAEQRELEKISILSAAEEARRREAEAKRQAEEDARRAAEDAERQAVEAEARRAAEAAAAAAAAAAPASEQVSQPRSEAQPEPSPETGSEPRAEARPEFRRDQRPEGRSDGRGDQRRDGARPEGRRDGRPDQRSDAPRGPRPEGGYQGRSDAPRGPRPEGGGYQGRSDAPRGPRPEGGYQGRSDAPRGPRPEGGYQGRPGQGPSGGRPQQGQGRPGQGGPSGGRPQQGGRPSAAPASLPHQTPLPTETLRLRTPRPSDDDDDRPRRGAGGAAAARKPAAPAPKKTMDDRRRGGGRNIDVAAAIEGEDEKVRSLASVRRQRERERRQAELDRLRADQVKVVREVILPEQISVQELANRMATRAADVVKSLMKMGVMATITQSLDADTAELVVQEFGHRVRRVSEADVEMGLVGDADEDIDLEQRAPVVTIMGHVDHGKTSLLDALRSADVAGGEAGGITQHIGAYQVTVPSGERITFIDTPGHEAFTAMRARGASVTDIVVLVVAADDGVMPQTIEAIRHAKAADVPIIVAINKMDKFDANPTRVRQELLQHDIVVEAMGGETQDVPVSALKKEGLDDLIEAILLQAEILDLRANPHRTAEGSVIESRLDRGRGPVGTVLVQRGTLHQGDIVVAGAEWGKVRAMLDDKGKPMPEAGPSTPVELLGLSGAPSAGEPFVVVESEARAREITEFRERRQREKAAGIAAGARGTLDQMLARIAAGEQKEVAVLIKADVQGSAEAIQVVVMKLEHEEVKVRVLLAGVGQITESDVQLAKASNAVIIAFNVRATAQARELAQRDNVDIRYFSIIYEVADDVEKMVKGKVAPKHREKFLGYAEVRKVFNITKTGKVAGCYITEGLVKRGAGVRVLRDNVVIHTGELSQLKRFKDDVKEVARGYECGLSFANFENLQEGDVVECYESELVPG